MRKLFAVVVLLVVAIIAGAFFSGLAEASTHSNLFQSHSEAKLWQHRAANSLARNSYPRYDRVTSGRCARLSSSRHRCDIRTFQTLDGVTEMCLWTVETYRRRVGNAIGRGYLEPRFGRCGEYFRPRMGGGFDA